jgi:hypothetical protein
MCTSWTRPESGIAPTAANAEPTRMIGHRKNASMSAFAGRAFSLINSFMPSQTFCRSPKGPETMGPRRSMKRASIFRSTQMNMMTFSSVKSRMSVAPMRGTMTSLFCTKSQSANPTWNVKSPGASAHSLWPSVPIRMFHTLCGRSPMPWTTLYEMSLSAVHRSVKFHAKGSVGAI